jgi:hypothetical protein
VNEWLRKDGSRVVNEVDETLEAFPMKAVAWAWRKSEDTSLLNWVAQVLGITPEEAEAILRNMLRRQ